MINLDLDLNVLEEKTVLVVDDDKMMRKMLTKAISSKYKVLEASNGEEAFEIIKNGRCSLVLLDIFMPLMDGWQFLEKLNDNPEYSNIPTIVMTAEKDNASELRALKLGALDVVQKPLVFEVLLFRIQNLLVKQDVICRVENSKIIEEQFIKQTEYLYKAEHDDLTGLYNKYAFFRIVREKIDASPNEKYMMLCWDIDGFSVYNDILSAEAGNKLLIGVANAIRSEASPGTVYARMETSTFVCFLSEETATVEHIYSVMLKRLEEFTPEFAIGCQVGVYYVNDPTVDVSILYSRAYSALKSISGNASKSVGVYDKALVNKIYEEKQLISMMVPALESNQFELYYQPQIDYSNGSYVGVEALVRWNHPEKGLLPPGAFIPLFEKNGLIGKLDYYVWEHACMQISLWLKKYGEKTIPISVNVSRFDVFRSGLTEAITALTDKYGIPRKYLRLEITESASIENPKELIKAVASLQSAGFTVEMDDFGSEYSSLNSLKDVPVDVIKLDLAFLSETDNIDRSEKIINSIVNMASLLNTPILAEGVETKAQAEFLKSLGCIYMQGYYFSKPVKITDFETQYETSCNNNTDK